VLVHRRELAHQAANKLVEAKIPHGVLAAGLDRDKDAPVLAMSVQSAARRLEQLPLLDFIVADEAHHAVSFQGGRSTAKSSHLYLPRRSISEQNRKL
jgi:superfamily II DNA or RNA helicase